MDFSKRLATSLLLAFVSSVLLVPVACGGMLLWNEHQYGDVSSNGPVALLAAIGIAGAISALVAVTAWVKSRPQ